MVKYIVIQKGREVSFQPIHRDYERQLDAYKRHGVFRAVVVSDDKTLGGVWMLMDSDSPAEADRFIFNWGIGRIVRKVGEWS